MSEVSTYMMMHDLEGFRTGSLNSEWPMHFTVVPFFTVEPENSEAVHEAVSDVVSHAKQFHVSLGEIAMFGPENNIPVIKLELINELKDLHHRLMRGVGDAGGQFIDTTYANQNYAPHITLKAGKRLPDDTLFRVKHVSLVEKMPKSFGHNNKLIIRQLDLPQS